MTTIPQAGAVAFRTDGPSVRILLVRAKKDPSKWIFPKGHLEPGESHAAAALRELDEEAGVTGIVAGLIGPALAFASGAEMVKVEYYLIHMVAEVASPEGRDKQWVSPPDALQQLAFPDARDLLRTALLEIERRAPPTVGTDRFGELLLKEYDHPGDSLLANEESGEKRVAFFLTLCGAVGAAVGFLVGNDARPAPSDRVLIGLSLLVLFVLGYMSFLRVVVRNAASDRYKNQLSRIRQSFLNGDGDPRIAWLPFHPYELTRRRPRQTWWHFGRGGWAETMSLVEALLGGSLVAFASWTLGESWDRNAALFFAPVLGIGAGCFVWRALLKRGDRLYNNELSDGRDGSVPLRGEAPK